MDTDALLQKLIEVSEEFKAQDLRVLEVEKVCDFADYFLIMSGTSNTHVQSISDALYLQTKHAGRHAISMEGKETGEWVLLDFGEIVVHIFLPQKRAHYDLEELWTRVEAVE